jgi:hypothetical protein
MSFRQTVGGIPHSTRPTVTVSFFISEVLIYRLSILLLVHWRLGAVRRGVKRQKFIR